MTRAVESPEQALAFLERALAILDANDVPADIGAHLDLAIERLYAFLGKERGFDSQMAG